MQTEDGGPTKDPQGTNPQGSPEPQGIVRGNASKRNKALEAFLFPRPRLWDSNATLPDLMFHDNLQEFAARVGILIGLEQNGSMSEEAAFLQVKALWKQLKASRRTLLSDDANKTPATRPTPAVVGNMRDSDELRASLQQFAWGVGIFCGLEAGGKLTGQDTYRIIKKMYKLLKKRYKQEFGQPPNQPPQGDPEGGAGSTP